MKSNEIEKKCGPCGVRDELRCIEPTSLKREPGVEVWNTGPVEGGKYEVFPRVPTWMLQVQRAPFTRLMRGPLNL